MGGRQPEFYGQPRLAFLIWWGAPAGIFWAGPALFYTLGVAQIFWADSLMDLGAHQMVDEEGMEAARQKKKARQK